MHSNGTNNTLLVGPYPPPFGGVSSHLYELNNSFRNSKYNFYILQFDSFSENSQRDGITIYKRATNLSFKLLLKLITRLDKLVYAAKFLLSNVLNSPFLYLGSFVKALHVIELIDKHDIERVVVYTTRIGSLIPFVKLYRPNVKIYYCIFADPYKNPEFYRQHKSWYKRAVENSTKVFSSSCYCADSYGNFTKNVSPSVIYVGVDLERFHQMDPIIARRKVLLKEKPTILFLGRMEPEMGAGNALEIAKILFSKGIDVNFVIAGAQGTLTESIIESSLQFGGKLLVKSNVSKEDLPYYYGASTISIAPTLGLHACMGVSIKEAMASGRPIIASDSGGIPEAIRDGIDGYVLPLESGEIDNDMFASRIIELLASQKNIVDFGANARKRCEEIFSVDAAAEKYLKLFENT
jgi:glycosyltransferase involved in cell wall biosynthesis